MLRRLVLPLALLAVAVSGCHHKYGRGYDTTPPVSDPVWRQPDWIQGKPEGTWTGPPAGHSAAIEWFSCSGAAC
ncbi:MAG TPA: hypothetical protein VML55_25335 [Planctomycetaceae bacterium]|nr:hypothetical protein [Planctomycetaceae bacterium]